MTQSSPKAPFGSDLTRCAPEAHLLHSHLQKAVSSREKEQPKQAQSSAPRASLYRSLCWVSVPTTEVRGYQRKQKTYRQDVSTQ